MEAKNIIEGFDEDLNSWADKFPRNFPDMLLTNFFEFWQWNGLNLLFVNRYDPRELHEVVQAYNQSIVTFLLTSIKKNNDKTTTVALYLLYCFHLVQPSYDWLTVKIRLTPDDAKNVHAFCQRSMSKPYGKHLNFVWKDLRKRNAIDYVEDRIVYGPGLLQARNNLKSKTYSDIVKNSQEDALLAQRAETIKFIEDKLEATLRAVEHNMTPYGQMRMPDFVSIKDPTDELKFEETSDLLKTYLDKTKTLLRDFKSTFQEPH